MADFNAWPWWLAAATGAVHGLNPLAGWGWTAHRAGHGRACLRHLGLVALGHALALAGGLLAVAQGLPVHRLPWPAAAAALTVAVLLTTCVRHPVARDMGRVLGGAAVSGLHGATTALLPALMPWCGIGGMVGPGTPPLPALVSLVAVHTLAMGATGVAVAGILRAAFGIRGLRFMLRGHESGTPGSSFHAARA